MIDSFADFQTAHHQEMNSSNKEQRMASAAMIESAKKKFEFPFTLHNLLDVVERSGLRRIISWDESGKAFRIFERKAFEEHILPQFFGRIKYKSFVRQLNIYGFTRVVDSNSPYYQYYHHQHFVKGNEQLCLLMIRVKVNGKGNNTRQKDKKNDYPSCARPVAPIATTSRWGSEHQERHQTESLQNLMPNHLSPCPLPTLPPSMTRRTTEMIRRMPCSQEEETSENKYFRPLTDTARSPCVDHHQEYAEHSSASSRSVGSTPASAESVGGQSSKTALYRAILSGHTTRLDSRAYSIAAARASNTLKKDADHNTNNHNDAFSFGSV